MASRNKPPPPIVTKLPRGLVPATAYDAEVIDGYALNTEFDLIPRTRRSHPQQGTYWKSLKLAVGATGRWPTDKALHRALKLKLGLVEPLYDTDGKIVGMQVESTSFDEMPHKEFCEYMDAAMAALSDAIGYDALAWLDE